MILGMSLKAFTLLHVYISLIAIGAGFIVVYGMIAAKRMSSVDQRISLHYRVDQPDGVSLSLSRESPPPLCLESSRSWCWWWRHCAPTQRYQRRLARNLRDLVNPGVLLQFLCPDCPVF